MEALGVGYFFGSLINKNLLDATAAAPWQVLPTSQSSMHRFGLCGLFLWLWQARTHAYTDTDPHETQTATLL